MMNAEDKKWFIRAMVHNGGGAAITSTEKSRWGPYHELVEEGLLEKVSERPLSPKHPEIKLASFSVTLAGAAFYREHCK